MSGSIGTLRGILLTPKLRSSIKDILALSSSSDESALDNADLSTARARPSTDKSPVASLKRVKDSKQALRLSPLPIKESISHIEAACKSYDAGDAQATLTLQQIHTLKHLIIKLSSPEQKKNLLTSLEKSIRPTSLIFQQSIKPSNKNDAVYQKRMAYLRQLNEERTYLASTSNLQKLNAHATQDDVNVKGMMYAMSVGLNMIVAPISFGVFMYFFAGSLFGRFFPDSDRNDNDVDIRQVIAGVLSGVILLFIEMILYVIRSHELDASVRKKMKRREYKSNPFGHTSKAMERTYNGEMD